jgi:hypothetical protein
MTKLRCWPGCVAQVVRVPVPPGVNPNEPIAKLIGDCVRTAILGKVITCVQLVPNDTDLPAWHFAGPPFAISLKPIGDIGRFLPDIQVFCIPDECLIPLSAPPGTDINTATEERPVIKVLA